MVSVRQQLRLIKQELLHLMEQELEAWELLHATQISEDAYRREQSMDGVRDFGGVVWAEVVDKPTEAAWSSFWAARKVKAKELADKGEACMTYWRGALSA